MIKLDEEEKEDVSICSRYTKYPHWNSVLETEFMEDLVSCYPNTSGLDLEMYFENKCEDGGNRPVLETPSWSLSLLECEGDGSSNVVNKPIVIPIMHSIKKKRKICDSSIDSSCSNSLKKSKVSRASHYCNHEDMSELYLIQDICVSGKRFVDQESSSTDDEDEVQNPEIFDKKRMYHPDRAAEEVLLMQKKSAGAHCKEFRRNPVRDGIRRTVQEALDKRVIKFKHEEEIWKKYTKQQDIRKETLKECPVMSTESAITFSSAVTVIDKDKHKYNTRWKNVAEVNSLKPTQQKPEKKKRTFLYEQKPFKDPVLEAKRMKCLYQKIYDDKKRFDYEILRVENKELRDENVRLRGEIQRLLLSDKRRRRVPGSCSDYTLSDSESASETESLIGTKKIGE